jgi:transketolase
LERKMLNPELKLNPNFLNGEAERFSPREGFGEGLALAAAADERIIGLSADVSDSVGMAVFKKKFPERFVEVGVAEQNLAALASGLAAAGEIPFIASYAVFNPGRNWEQIRTTICYNNQPVKIVGSHAGVSVGADGGSHQALEDIALMRVLPRMIVLSPCDALETRKAITAAAKTDGPVYIRFGREKTPVITTEETPFEIGKAQIFFDSRFKLRSDLKSGERSDLKRLDVGIIAIGAMTARALRAAAELEKEGINAVVINLGTIKPIDEKAVIGLAKETGAVVTAEDHQIAGGMGSAVAELLSANYPVPIEFVGVRDKFGQSGKSEELMEYYGMSEADIKGAVKVVLARKKAKKVL